MNITFDVYEKMPEILHVLDRDIKVTFREILLFVQERLYVLKEQMESQEALRPCCVIINLLSAGFDYTGYSHELIDKMDDCFAQSDMAYLAIRVQKALDEIT